MRTMALGVLTIVAGLLGNASWARALDHCKVVVDARTGLLRISAKNVAGTLTWQDAPGGPLRTFFDAACVVDGTAKRCLLDAPMTLAARTPPVGCTVFLADAGASCSAPVPGCSPAVRPLDLPRALVGTWALSGGGTITFHDDNSFADSEGATGTYRTVGNAILLDIDSIAGEFNAVLTYLGTLPSGQLIFAQENVLGLTRLP